MFNVLIVSNSDELIANLKSNILSALDSFQTKVVVKKSAIDALNFINQKELELIIADINLNDLNGIEFFSNNLRIDNTTTHKILVSDKHEDYIKAAAYDVGVDDFISDQISPSVLQKKIIQIFNRLNRNNRERIYYKSLVIDKSKFIITNEKQKYILPKKQFLIYALLCAKPGQVFSRDEIYYNVWKENMPRNNRSVDVHIREIRKSIPQNNLKTFRGIGYMVESAN